MASTASASSSSRSREAGPLPRKVGEFGYSPRSPAPTVQLESVPEAEGDITEEAGDEPSMSASSPPSTTTQSSSEAPATAAVDRSGINETTTTTTTSPSQSTSSLPEKNYPWYKRLVSTKGGPLVFGLRGPTLIKITVLILILGAVGAAWGLSAIRISAAADKADDKDPTGMGSIASYMGVFIHVAFAVAVLVILTFVERTVFVLRAERWLHKNPGMTLPLHRGGERVTRQLGGWGSAPWNRPPLPTYAAALGYRGTGDVEDENIQAPPPPAYGNTRGSVLLLASAIRRISGSSSANTGSNRNSQVRSPRTPRTPRQFLQIPESRPVSYISAEGYEDVQRAHQLELSLARLEAGQSSAPRTT